uniref:Unconventional prefoldin RPB5 interactor n=1 Tax=Acrobeloides nanus TaxID=290746 RepID=A0A914E6V8_9BILA
MLIDPSEKARIFYDKTLLEIEKYNQIIGEKTKEIEEYQRLKSELTEMSKKLHHEILAPIGSIGCVKAQVNNPNEIFVFLGENYFVERNSFQTIEIIDRRIKAFTEFIQNLEKQKENMQRLLNMTTNVLAETDGQIEIWEPYDETSSKKTKKFAQKDKRVHVGKEVQGPKKVSDKEFQALMNRLDELEMLEDASYNENSIKNMRKNIQNAVIEQKEEEVQRPKNVSDEEFQTLMNRLDELEMLEDEENSESEEDEDVPETSQNVPSHSMKLESRILERTLGTLNALAEQHTELDLDSDDSLPVKKLPAEKPKLKRKVSFAKQITSDQVQEKDPPEVLNLHAPKSILRNKDKKSPINEDLVQEMSQRDVKKIVSMNDQVFSGIIKEKNTTIFEDSTTSALEMQPATQEIRPKVSKFKAERMKMQ